MYPKASHRNPLTPAHRRNLQVLDARAPLPSRLDPEDEESVRHLTVVGRLGSFGFRVLCCAGIHSFSSVYLHLDDELRMGL